jgi:hypothetical protein
VANWRASTIGGWKMALTMPVLTRIRPVCAAAQVSSSSGSHTWDSGNPASLPQFGRTGSSSRSLTDTAWNPNVSVACATVTTESGPTYGPKCGRLTPIRGTSMSILRSHSAPSLQ